MDPSTLQHIAEALRPFAELQDRIAAGRLDISAGFRPDRLWIAELLAESRALHDTAMRLAGGSRGEKLSTPDIVLQPTPELAEMVRRSLRAFERLGALGVSVVQQGNSRRAVIRR